MAQMRPGALWDSSYRPTSSSAAGADESWEPLPPRSIKPKMVLVVVVALSALGGFTTFALLSGNGNRVSSAETANTSTTVETTTTSTTAEPNKDEKNKDHDQDHGGGAGPATDSTPTTEAPAQPAETAPPPPEGSGEVSGPSPEDTVREFWTAMQNSDCEKVIDLMTKESWSMGGSVSREQAVASCKTSPGAGVGMEVTDVKLAGQEGNKAVVDITISYSGETMTQQQPLQVEDGRWKVASF